jgi:hypothetical protein
MRPAAWRQIGGEEFQIFPLKFEKRTLKFVKSIQVLDYQVRKTSFGKGISKK